jgi:hypothetical protein
MTAIVTSPGRCRSDDIPLNRTGAAHVVPDRDQTHPGPTGNGAPDARYHEGASDEDHYFYFAADTGAGMAKGQGLKAFGSGWYVVNAKGSKIDDD